MKPFGIMVHTTGSGVHKHHDKLPEVAAMEYYTSSNIGPHYVIDGAGNVYELLDSLLRANHCGITAEVRSSLLDGTWRSKVPSHVVEAWDRRWSSRGATSPAALYPSKSPNDDYIGIELIPIPKVGEHPGTELSAADDFTVEQYLALADLIAFEADRHDIDLGNPRTLVEHSDTNPIGRPGWDPGGMIGKYSPAVLQVLINAVKERWKDV
jgi:N-acetyl-anhydromuramyl-L-alanine amidase AmpD